MPVYVEYKVPVLVRVDLDEEAIVGVYVDDEQVEGPSGILALAWRRVGRRCIAGGSARREGELADVGVRLVASARGESSPPHPDIGAVGGLSRPVIASRDPRRTDTRGRGAAVASICDYSPAAAFDAFQSTARVWPSNAAPTAETSRPEPAM